MRVLFTPECQNKKNVICRKGLQDPVTNLCDLAGFEILITPAQTNESNYEALEAMATSLGKSHKSGLQKNPEVSRTSTICATQIHGIDAFLAVRAIRAPCRIRVQSAQCRMSEASEEFGWGNGARCQRGTAIVSQRRRDKALLPPVFAMAFMATASAASVTAAQGRRPAATAVEGRHPAATRVEGCERP